jgi:acyl-CoA thioester hydrolase
MPALFQLELTVAADDIDELGHASNLAYLHWMQSAALGHSAVQGWPIDAYRALGAGWVVRSHQIEYLQPAFAEDAVVVQTWVANMKKVTSLRRYKIVRRQASGETILATAATDWAFIDFATRVPKRIPPEVSGAFEVLVDPG